MKDVQFEARCGADAKWRLTILGTADAAVTTYTGLVAPVCRVWPGGNYATSFTMTAAWVSAAAGTITLAIDGTDTADLTPGLYEVELELVGSTGTAIRPIGTLRLTPAPGSAVAPRVYATLADLEAECSWIGDVDSLKDSRAANFLQERAQASRWAEDQAMARWQAAGADQAMRHGPIVAVDPIVPTAGYDAGPAWGASAIPDTTLRAAEAAFAAMLDGVGLMAGYGPDRGKLARLVALYTLHLALDDQVGMAPGSEETSLQSLGARYRSRALRMLPGVVFRVDEDADGVPDYELRY